MSRRSTRPPSGNSRSHRVIELDEPSTSSSSSTAARASTGSSSGFRSSLQESLFKSTNSTSGGRGAGRNSDGGRGAGGGRSHGFSRTNSQGSTGKGRGSTPASRTPGSSASSSNTKANKKTAAGSEEEDHVPAESRAASATRKARPSSSSSMDAPASNSNSIPPPPPASTGSIGFRSSLQRSLGRNNSNEQAPKSMTRSGSGNSIGTRATGGRMGRNTASATVMERSERRSNEPSTSNRPSGVQDVRTSKSQNNSPSKRATKSAASSTANRAPSSSTSVPTKFRSSLMSSLDRKDSDDSKSNKPTRAAVAPAPLSAPISPSAPTHKTPTSSPAPASHSASTSTGQTRKRLSDLDKQESSSSNPETKKKDSTEASLSRKSSMESNAVNASTPPLAPISTPPPARSTTPAPAPAPTISDDEKRRLANEKLRQRFEARKLERAASGTSSVSSSFSSSSLSPQKDRTSRVGADSRNDSSPQRVQDKQIQETAREKEQRVREFYARLDQEAKQKEAAAAANRTNVFKSSLLASMDDKSPPAPLSAPVGRSSGARVGSSIGASIGMTLREAIQARNLDTKSKSVVPTIDKVTFTLNQLYALRSKALPRPNNLPDMRIVEVTEVRKKTERDLAREKGMLSKHRDHKHAIKSKKERGGGTTSKRKRSKEPFHKNQPSLDDLPPAEPIQHIANRWVASTTKNRSVLDTTLANVKALLNKLTREKFAKLTDEICAVELADFEVLRKVVSVIMDKALEEPSFADVYAELCREFHLRTCKTLWNFLKSIAFVEDANHADKVDSYYWSAVRFEDFRQLYGPFQDLTSCLQAAAAGTDAEHAAPLELGQKLMPTDFQFYLHHDFLIGVYAQSATNQLFCAKKAVKELSEDEPLIGSFGSVTQACQAAAKQTSFKRLLVTRCQHEFEKHDKLPAIDVKSAPDQETARKLQIQATQMKRLMLGNIRFIGELFKVDMLNQAVVKSCTLKLLGLELVTDPSASSDQICAQAVRIPDEEELEALCKFLTTVGKKMDADPRNTDFMNLLISRMVELSENKTSLTSRARFLLKDVLETRDHMWQPRRQELQKKTLEEVRQEAQRLLKMGKNAQHDQLVTRRLKKQVSSAQVAKQGKVLILSAPASQVSASRQSEEPKDNEAPSNDTHAQEDEQSHDHSEKDISKLRNRVQAIIQEFFELADVQEAMTCVQEELPSSFRGELLEQLLNFTLEGKQKQRELAMRFVVVLYERNVVTATLIQQVLCDNALEFLEDLRIDIPLVHEYVGLLMAKLICVGCFGLKYVLVTCKKYKLVANGLCAKVFASVLHGMAHEGDPEDVSGMIADEEILNVQAYLPAKLSQDQYLADNNLEEYFHPSSRKNSAADHSDDESDDSDEDDDTDRDDDEDEEEDEAFDPLRPELKTAIQEYICNQDVDEFVLCVNELQTDTSLSNDRLYEKSMHLLILVAFEAKTKDRAILVELVQRLLVNEQEAWIPQFPRVLQHAISSLLQQDYSELLFDLPNLPLFLAEFMALGFATSHESWWVWLANELKNPALTANDQATKLLAAVMQQTEFLVTKQMGINHHQFSEWWQEQEREAVSQRQ